MVGLPPPHIEVAALDDHGQFGLLEQRRKAHKISSCIASHGLSSHLRGVATATIAHRSARSSASPVTVAPAVVRRS
ncbi:MAG: hypothetical protein QOJ73_4711, partial [Streptosporangiaceae bacterium]|nr:hypothetical protein [Streptosporangiaceae bacterium]